MREATRRRLTRVAAPTAFLAAATVAILLVRPALDRDVEANLPTRPVATSTAPASTATPGRGGRAGAPRYVRVGRGDTLESIAARMDTTVESLLTLNPQIDPVAMRVGQRVRVR